MTAKRFTLKEYVTNHYAILDNGKEIAYADHKSAFSICELLNELHEENKQYKILTDELKRQNQKLKGRLKDLGVEYYD